VTADNATNNDKTIVVISKLLKRRGVKDWKARQRRLGCLSHSVQLGIESFMGEVTHVAVIESREAIWEFDPS
ncbi:hypothetical protein L226DRAFT_434854, partial [Lentinus tigrinus ALCF2SS1-7]|uniref:uncharacterized protein n=1 Tax=Lentinus tigrinus ALCF2SS1-7 TaxID=1328758 RepID=UPI0011660ABB